VLVFALQATLAWAFAGEGYCRATSRVPRLRSPHERLLPRLATADKPGKPEYRIAFRESELVDQLLHRRCPAGLHGNSRAVHGGNCGANPKWPAGVLFIAAVLSVLAGLSGFLGDVSIGTRGSRIGAHSLEELCAELMESCRCRGRQGATDVGAIYSAFLSTTT
jgi:hypothetical protein